MPSADPASASGVESHRPTPTGHAALAPLAAAGEPWRILLVDDEAEFVDTLAERLRLRGYNPSVAYGGQDALARACGEPPHVVVLDMYMPGMSGLDVLRMLHFSHPEVKVIILTGHESVREAMACRRLGAFDYLTKPISIDDLLGRIDEAMGTPAGLALAS
ncbi:response regulator [Megalodesulfovibrio paquesii]